MSTTCGCASKKDYRLCCPPHEPTFAECSEKMGTLEMMVTLGAGEDYEYLLEEIVEQPIPLNKLSELLRKMSIALTDDDLA
eukprot:12540976-Heterocapsa_arctica.AAC.1